MTKDDWTTPERETGTKVVDEAPCVPAGGWNRAWERVHSVTVAAP